MLSHMPKVTEQVGDRVRTSKITKVKGVWVGEGRYHLHGELTTASRVQGVSLCADNGHPAPSFTASWGLLSPRAPAALQSGRGRESWVQGAEEPCSDT